ncbi:MAG: hypothetical protein IIY81_09455 [Lachnospiraceae bacterium]|nr:hypothetical protein [Lachnospiraceae bacterium]
MIKGISRQIIEINETQNNYFERAWLVVKPEYLNVGASRLEREAEGYLKNLKPPYSMRSRKGLLLRLLGLCSAALGGSVITAAILLSGNL